jgi:hypothetical protein
LQETLKKKKKNYFPHRFFKEQEHKVVFELHLPPDMIRYFPKRSIGCNWWRLGGFLMPEGREIRGDSLERK